MRVTTGSCGQEAAARSPVLAEKQIAIEINVTSNIRTGCCPSFAGHPLRTYFDSGLFVTLNSQFRCLTRSGANLLDEYVLAHQHYRFTPDQLRELAANSAAASFLPPHQKLALLSRIEQHR
jgi:adenosine deaminase/aminodeoxyfutalosine deaminase